MISADPRRVCASRNDERIVWENGLGNYLRCSRGRSRLVFVLNLSVRRRPRIIHEQTAIQAFEMIECLMRGSHHRDLTD